MADESLVPASQAVAELTGTTPAAPIAPPAPAVPEPVAAPAPVPAVPAAPIPGEPQVTDGPEVLQGGGVVPVAPAVPAAPANQQTVFDQLMVKYRTEGRTENEARELLAQGVYGNQNQMAELTKVVGEMQQTLQSRAQPQEELTSPRLQRVDSELAAMDARSQSFSTQQTQALTNINKLEKAIARAEGKAEGADDYDRSVINDEIRGMRDQLRTNSEAWRSNNTQAQQDVQRIEQLGYEREEALGEIDQYKQHLSQQETDAVVAQQATLQEFGAATAAALEAYAIPEANKEHLVETIRAQAITYLRSLPEDAPQIDIPAFVQHQAQQYRNAIDAAARASFGQFSQNKANVMPAQRVPLPPVVTPHGQPAAPGSPTQGGDQWSADQARERARRILG